mmetsp:Transcript_35242/g.91556  ORF Transcript_35242/g.91556 Transcript_35242/m.91556 type:complete len:246 (-) Transcript_35242:1144-1881(-)
MAARLGADPRDDMPLRADFRALLGGRCCESPEGLEPLAIGECRRPFQAAVFLPDCEDVRCWPGVRDWRVAIGESPALAVELELGPSSHMKETRSETEGTLTPMPDAELRLLRSSLVLPLLLVTGSVAKELLLFLREAAGDGSPSEPLLDELPPSETRSIAEPNRDAAFLVTWLTRPEAGLRMEAAGVLCSAAEPGAALCVSPLSGGLGGTAKPATWRAAASCLKPRSGSGVLDGWSALSGFCRGV